MLSLADFLAPVTPEAFLRDTWGQRPLHIPAQGAAGEAKRALLPWARLNALLGVRGYWTDRLLKLVRDRDPVDPEHFCDSTPTLDGVRRYADPAKVKVFTDMGATMVANEIQGVSPELQAVAAAVSAALGAQVRANAYCSFQRVQGFGPHFDTSDVLAVQTEGEKVWRLYERRADNPVEFPEGDDDQIRDWLDRTKGRLVSEITMRPGDVLYLPRGAYHDALASGAASLHLTFSLQPHTAKVLFRLLEQEAMKLSAFRAYLPSTGEPGALEARLGELAERLKALVAAPAFAAEVRGAQRALTEPAGAYSLPARDPVEMFQVTGQPAEAARRGDALVLRSRGGEIPITEVQEPAGWMLGRPAFALGELLARFPGHEARALRSLVEAAARAGLLRRV